MYRLLSIASSTTHFLSQIVTVPTRFPNQQEQLASLPDQFLTTVPEDYITNADSKLGNADDAVVTEELMLKTTRYYQR